MARGWDPVEQDAVAARERQERFDATSNVQMLRLKQVKEGAPGAGGPIIVRFLEQGPDVNSFVRHIFKKPDARAKSGFFEQLETCLTEINQQCPACAAGIPTKRRGAYNLIQRQRAVYRKGADGKPVKDANNNYSTDGYADAVVVFDCSNTSANVIRRADNDFRGLMSREIAISFTGDNKNPYAISPADIDSGPQQMSDADRALAVHRYDLDKIFAPPSAHDMASLIAKYGANSGATQSHIPSAAPPAAANPYLAGAQLPSGSPFAAAQAPVQQPQEQPPAPPAPAQG